MEERELLEKLYQEVVELKEFIIKQKLQEVDKKYELVLKDFKVDELIEPIPSFEYRSYGQYIK